MLGSVSRRQVSAEPIQKTDECELPELDDDKKIWSCMKYPRTIVAMLLYIFIIVALVVVVTAIGVEKSLTTLVRWIDGPHFFLHAATSMVLLIFMNVLCLPGIILVIMANGFLFGLVTGFWVSWGGMVLGAMLSFGLGRWLVMDQVRGYIQQYESARVFLAVMEDSRNSMKLLFLSRFLPSPVWAKNYLTACLDVRWDQFAIPMAVASAIYEVIFVYVGSRSRSLSGILSRKDESTTGAEVFVFVLCVVMTASMICYALKEYKKKAEELLDEEANPYALLPDPEGAPESKQVV